MENGETFVQYPWLRCVSQLQDNSCQARAVQSRIEASLRGKGQLEVFNAEMEKALTEGKFSLVPRKELQARRESGLPMNYISIFGLEQPTYTGHKLRVMAK